MILRNILKNPGDTPPEVTGNRIGDRLIDSGVVSQSQIDVALENRDDSDEKLGETLVKQNVVPAKAALPSGITLIRLSASLNRALSLLNIS